MICDFIHFLEICKIREGKILYFESVFTSDVLRGALIADSLDLKNRPRENILTYQHVSVVTMIASEYLWVEIFLGENSVELLMELNAIYKKVFLKAILPK